MKLKTLKDFEKECNQVEYEALQEVKQEAIKWVKELRRTTGTTGRLDYRLSFKQFFNITEDELK